MTTGSASVTTTSSTTRGSHVAVHEISFHGLAGTIFWCNILALLIYTLGFATVGWQIKGNDVWIGLWHECTCNLDIYAPYDWFRAAQAMFTLGLVGLIMSSATTLLYMFFHKISKNFVIMAFAIITFLSVAFMVIGLVIFGVKTGEPFFRGHNGRLGFSYAFAAVGTFLSLCAGILALVQMWKSRVV